jgi:N4-gp56 family major capsid protein
MATTNFSALGLEEKIVWARELWAAARNASFVMQFTGKGPNSMIQRITELTKSEKGARAIITLVADLTGDGVMGDSTMENNEEAIKAHDTEIRIDQLRNANRLEGRMADQKSVVSFRETSKDVLAYWMADRIDQLGFLTLSSVAVTQNTNGSVRAVRPAGQNFSDLEFVEASPVPTTNRYYNWNFATLAFVAGDTTASGFVATDTISYQALVELKATAKTDYIRGIKGAGGMEYYHVFMHPKCLAKLKLDSDYLASLQNAGPRSGSNPIFSGAVVTVDGLVIHEHRHSYNTLGAASGSAWGTNGLVDGNAVLFCGAQAMAIADIGLPYWDEETFDYGNQHGISVGKIFGMLKPQFKSIYDGTDVNAARDFGVIRANFAI